MEGGLVVVGGVPLLHHQRGGKGGAALPWAKGTMPHWGTSLGELKDSALLIKGPLLNRRGGGEDYEVLGASFELMDALSTVFLQDVRHPPHEVQPGKNERQNERDELHDEHKALVWLSPAAAQDAVVLDDKQRKVLEEEHAVDSVRELVGAIFGGVRILRCPNPHDAADEDVVRRADNGEGKVCPGHAIAIDVRVDAKEAHVVSDGKGAGDKVEDEQGKGGCRVISQDSRVPERHSG